MWKRHQPNWRTIALYPAVFVIIVSGLYLYGMSQARYTTPPRIQPAASVEISAPSAADYRQQVRLILEPFFELVASYPAAAGVSADPVLAQVVAGWQQELLALTVPAAEREAHLSAVLLLDQWQRALNGSPLDGGRALASVDQLLSDYPWLIGL
jgi:hypothetical protein